MNADAVICGAGIAGISAAYSLAVELGLQRIALVDAGAPLGLTSDHSTECYRNWWPGPDAAMVSLMNRSIDRLEALARQSGNVFHMNRRGYLYCTGDPERAAEMERIGRQISDYGAGPLRIHSSTGHTGSGSSTYQPHTTEGFENAPVGADLLLGSNPLHSMFPYLSPQIIAALHVRRAGWFSAQQLGIYLLEQSRSRGVALIHDRVIGIETQGGRISRVQLAGGESISTPVFVNAAGPGVEAVAGLIGVNLPVYHELHLKMAFSDSRHALPRGAPLVILSDPQMLDWSEEERAWLRDDVKTLSLLDELPPGLHTRPDGGEDSPIILALWEFAPRRMSPAWPIPEDPMYPDVLMRGLPRLIPEMSSYVKKSPRPRIDGGYYTRTAENRPLIGPLPVPGAFVIGALSGFGLMAACGAGELLAAHVTGSNLPDYAPAFELERYEDPEYQARLAAWGDSGQL